MNKIYIFVISIILAGCATGTAFFDLYSASPIEVDCAYEAINGMRSFDFVTRSENAVEFSSMSVKGKLFHGAGGEAFIQYGIEVSTSPILGPDVKEVADRVSGELVSACVKSSL